MTRRVTVALSNELAEALDDLAGQRGESRSGLVEMLLRENGYVQHAVDRLRREATRGRSGAD